MDSDIDQAISTMLPDLDAINALIIGAHQPPHPAAIVITIGQLPIVKALCIDQTVP